MNHSEARNAVNAAIEKRRDFLCSVGTHIWNNPEPGFREEKTSAYLVDIFKSLESIRAPVTIQKTGTAQRQSAL